MITFAREPFAAWHQEAKPLFRKHWEEVGMDRDKIALNVDYGRFLGLDKAGVLPCYTARQPAAQGGALAGYAVFLATPHLHYMDHVFAYCDVVYLADRGPGAALRFFDYFIEDMRLQDRVSKFLFHEKVANASFGAMLKKRFKAKHAENLYTVTVI